MLTKFKYLFITIILIACKSSSPKESVGKPNILFIVVDDLGYSDLSCMGSNYYETPNVDALAKNGVLFTNGYAGASVCSPSRATLLTGQFTATHGITDWIGAPVGEDWRNKGRYSKLLPATYNEYINSNTLTLPQALKNVGYSTFFAGKWHLGDKGHFPENYGFDINIGGNHHGSPAGGYFAPFNNPQLENHANGENLTMRLANETANFIKQTKDKPFLAYLSFYAVHGPIQTTKEKWQKYRNKAEQMGIAKQGFEDGDLLPVRKHQDNPVYGGLVETMDDAVGVVLKALKETGLDKNTLVIFTSDNGGVTSGDNYSTNCLPLKGGKGYQWEGGIRVPFIVSAPWIQNQTQKNNVPVTGADLFPTILDLAGVQKPSEAKIDGVSLIPILKGKSLKKRPLYWHYPHYGNQGGRPVSIVRLGDWKLIHYWEDNHNELYNLKTDLHEDHNLAKRYPQKTQQMANQLLIWLRSVDAKYPQQDPNYNSFKEQEAIMNKKEHVFKSQEELRKKMLNKNWQPNDDWWGSQVIND